MNYRLEILYSFFVTKIILTLEASPISSKEERKGINGTITTSLGSDVSISPTAQSLTDFEVLSGLQKGDESILGYAYSQYSKTLFRFGMQYTTDRDLVMDSIHDVFVNLMSSRQSLQKIQSIKSYLYASLYRRIVYYLNRRKYLDIKIAESNQFPVAFHPELTLIMDEENREKLEKVKAGIEKLSKKQRQAILHYYTDGFNHQEIAQIMGLRNTNSVAKLIARGLGAIRGFVEKIDAGFTQMKVLFLFSLIEMYA